MVPRLGCQIPARWPAQKKIPAIYNFFSNTASILSICSYLSIAVMTVHGTSHRPWCLELVMFHRPARNVPAIAQAPFLTPRAKSRAFCSRHVACFPPCAIVIPVLAYHTVRRQHGSLRPRCGDQSGGTSMVGMVACICGRALWWVWVLAARWAHHSAIPQRQMPRDELYRFALLDLPRLPARMRAEDGRDRHPQFMSVPFYGGFTL